MSRYDRYSSDETIWSVALSLFILAVFGACYLVKANASASCLAAGYPDVRYDWTATFYCVKRENQSDVVKRLSEVKR